MKCVSCILVASVRESVSERVIVICMCMHLPDEFCTRCSVAPSLKSIMMCVRAFICMCVSVFVRFRRTLLVDARVSNIIRTKQKNNTN